VHASGGPALTAIDVPLGIVAIDDVWGLTLCGLVVPLVTWMAGDGGGSAFAAAALRELGGGVALGVALGVPMAYLTGRLKAGEPTRLEALGFVLLCGGLATWLDASYLLAAVVMGATVANLARHHERAFHEIENIDAPFLVIFFVLAGASLELDALAQAGALAATAYVLLRVVGRMAGAVLGVRLLPAPAVMGHWMGLALMPQAGVALGLALAVSERFPELGADILPLVIVATTFFEIVGPVLTRLALSRAGDVPG
jgi:Kef-type K+ transport system membrane component KefB